MKIFLFFLLSFILSGCSGNYNFAWFAINPLHSQGLSNIEFLIGGLFTTISVSLVSLILAAILGLIVTLPNLSSRKSLKYLFLF